MKIIMCGVVTNKEIGENNLEEVVVTSDKSEVIITFKNIEVRLDKIDFKNILHIIKDIPIGLDLVDFEPDYTKTWEENWKEYREQYFKVYGEYPPEPEDVGKITGLN